MFEISGFKLALANGLQWVLVASPELEEWISMFASLMRLPYETASRQAARLIFTSMDWTASSLVGTDTGDFLGSSTSIPRTGWKIRDMRALRLWTHPYVQDVICQVGPDKSKMLDIMRMLMSLEPVYAAAIHSGGLPLHAALIERHGLAVLLAGPGGIGKSTCCRRLPAPWRSHCDDEVIIVRDKRQRLVAHPIPTWSDHLWTESEKTWPVTEHYVLVAIFFLKRAETDSALRLAQHEVASLLTRSSRDVFLENFVQADADGVRPLRRKQFENACRLAKELPAFVLNVSPTGEFWQSIERVLEEAQHQSPGTNMS